MKKAKQGGKAMLPLDEPRSISLKGKSRTYTYTLRRAAEADWRKYFAGIVHQTLHVEGAREQVFDADSALVELVGALLIRVEGYGDLAGIEDWKSALPFTHRLAVGVALRNVGAEDQPGEGSPICGLEEVRLSAAWPIDGQTLIYEGLVHRLRHPSAAQLRKFNFEASRVRVRGNAENGVSIYPARQAIAMGIYDELIESVDGYSVGGAPLSGVENIRREMDGAHKAAAALRIFQGEEEVSVE